MKKFIAIVIGMLFVFGLSATAFAIHAEIPSETQAVVAKGETQVTISGNVRVRGEVRSITTAKDGVTGAAYDERVRLGVDAKLSDSVSGMVELESGSNTSDTYTWGSHDNGAKGAYSVGNSKAGGMSILQAWMLYKSGNMGLKVGHMPLALGNKLFFDHTKFGDDAIVFFMDPNSQLHVGVLTIKLQDQGTSADSSGDQDAYVALGVFKHEMFTASGDVTYVNIGTDSSFGATPSYVVNVGLRADANIGPAKVKADAEIQTGKLGKDTAGEMDVTGMAVLLNGSMSFGSVNASVEFGYGSGDDAGTGDEMEGFITSLSSGVPYPGFIYGPRVPSAGGSGAGISNTTYLKASVGTKLENGVGLKGDVIYLMASEADEDAIGIEVDATATYSLAKNLKYWIEAGYLVVDDYYGSDAEDAWAMRHGLELSF